MEKFRYYIPYIPYISANPLEVGCVVLERDSEIETLDDVLTIANRISAEREVTVTILDWKRIQ